LSEREREGLFELLDPPPGGLTRLRAGLRAERRRRTRNRTLAGALATAAAAAILLVLLVPGGGARTPLPGLESDLLAVRLGLAEAPEEVVSVRPDLRREYAVRQVPTSDERVVFYLVGSRETPAPREEAEGEPKGI
jgi:hypothetical protein